MRRPDRSERRHLTGNAPPSHHSSVRLNSWRSTTYKASFQRLGVGRGGASTGPECVRMVVLVGAYGDRQSPSLQPSAPTTYRSVFGYDSSLHGAGVAATSRPNSVPKMEVEDAAGGDGD
eukprot:3118604-Prymnesium_polylepis.1